MPSPLWSVARVSYFSAASASFGLFGAGGWAEGDAAAIPSREEPMGHVDGPDGWMVSGCGSEWRDLPWYVKAAVIAAVLGVVGVFVLIAPLD